MSSATPSPFERVNDLTGEPPLGDNEIPLPEGPDDGDPWNEDDVVQPAKPFRPRIVEGSGGVDVVPAPFEPMAVARVLLAELTHDDHLLLRRWRGEWWRYRGPHWAKNENEALRKLLYERLEHASFSKWNSATRQHEPAPWSPDKTKIDRVLDAMGAVALLPGEVEAPSWLSTNEAAAGIVPCRNGLVDVAARTVRSSTPDYFGTVEIPLNYDPDIAQPAEWLAFLDTLWPDSNEEVAALQEWMGYVLSGRLDLQKLLLLVGPTRSGKGTVARILIELVGKANTVAPTLAGLATNFGLQPLIGKPLGVVGDARLASNGQEAVVERLLSISGQDSITIDRKNLTAWTGTLPTRLMILSNELPKFGDASAAIASRFVVLTFRRSFLGCEDLGLEERLRAELPAILKWALAGLARLQANGKLTEPSNSREMVQTLHDLVSPIRAFIREVCNVSNEQSAVPFGKLYTEYKTWCDENHRGVRNTAGFSSDLQAALPWVKTDYRPKIDGQKLPRHVRGIALNAEWVSRDQATTERAELGRAS